VWCRCQQQDEGAEVLRCQPLSVDLGLHQLGRDVVTRLSLPVLAQIDGVLEELDDGLGARSEIADLAVADAEDEVDELPQARAVLRRDVQEIGDDLEREVRSDGVDEVELAGLADLVDDRVGEFADVVGHPANGTR
jgi:hypothetical protein